MEMFLLNVGIVEAFFDCRLTFPVLINGTKLKDRVFYKYAKIYFLNEERLHDLLS